MGLAIACGVGGAFAAIIFRVLIRFFTGAFFAGTDGISTFFQTSWLAEAGDPLELARMLPWWAKLLIPALGGLAVGPLITFFPREAKGHGVPEVMEAVALRGGLIRARTVALRTLASALTIGAGGSVGREGPIVQIGAALGSAIGQFLRVPPRLLRTLVGCGAAAGIAATFNAPIAGALFAVEIIIGDFAVAQLGPIVISSVVATVLSRWLLGDHPSLQVPVYQLMSPFELLPYAVVGVAAGLVGLAFMRLLYALEDGFERLRAPEWLKPALGGVAVGAIGIVFPQIFGVGYGTITPALAGALAPALLAALLLAKLLATSITVGSGGSGGVFAPSLFLGAMTGGFLGSLVHSAFPESTATSGAYAVVAMGAVVAATTHAPITAIVMIFEMTQEIRIIPPLMTACVVSTLLATFLFRESIYTMKLVRRGVDVRADPHPSVLRRLRVSEIMSREPARVSASATHDEILKLAAHSPHVEFYVVDDGGVLLGAISLSALRALIFDQGALREVTLAADLASAHPPTVREDDDLDAAMQVLGQSELDEIAVVDLEGHLVGSVTSQQLIDTYNAETLRRDLAGGVSTAIGIAGRVRQVALEGGWVVQEIEAPLAFWGRTLQEIGVRAHHGVQVVLIRTSSAADPARRVRVPTPGERVRAGDVLLVTGPKEAVEALLHA